MKNILREKPTQDLHGRLLESVNFLSDADLIGKDILDIGCGYGWFELNILNRGVDKIVGIELSEENLETAKNNIKDKKISFGIGSAIDLPFGSESFDTVVAWEVIEHIPKGTEDLMFREIKRVLKDGGVLYLSTPCSSILSKIADPAWWLIGHRHYSQEKIRKLAQRNNFKEVEMKIKGRWWTIINILNMYFSKWILRRPPLFRNFFGRKIDEEYQKSGFVSAFVKFQK